MVERDQLIELLGAMQRDLLPSLVRMHEADDLQMLHAVVLRIVERGDHPTIKQVAALIGRSVSRTSRIIDQLVRRDLLMRDEDHHDRRTRRLRLSANGHALVHRIQEIRQVAMFDLFDHLDTEERATVMSAMELLAKAARKVRDERDPVD